MASPPIILVVSPAPNPDILLPQQAPTPTLAVQVPTATVLQQPLNELFCSHRFAYARHCNSYWHMHAGTPWLLPCRQQWYAGLSVRRKSSLTLSKSAQAATTLTTVPRVALLGPPGSRHQAVTSQKESVGLKQRNHPRPADIQQQDTEQKLTCSWVGFILCYVAYLSHYIICNGPYGPETNQYSLLFRRCPRSRYGQMPQVHGALVPALRRHGFMVAGQIHVPGEHYCQVAITNCAGVSDMGPQ